MSDHLREAGREKLARSLGVMLPELQPGEVRTVRIDTSSAAQENRPERATWTRLPDEGEWEPVGWSDYFTAALVVALILAAMVVVGALVGP